LQCGFASLQRIPLRLLSEKVEAATFQTSDRFQNNGRVYDCDPALPESGPPKNFVSEKTSTTAYPKGCRKPRLRPTFDS
jgi:hypothetical protein